MKIPLQEKIAELEQRIVRLEEQANIPTVAAAYSSTATNGKKTVRTATPYSKGIDGNIFGPHWHKMWEEFHLAMKEMFE